MEDSQIDTKAKKTTTSRLPEQEALNPNGDRKPWLVKTRTWLSDNKIFFETVAVVALPLMVIIILIAQLIVIQNQADISEKQADISEKQTDIVERQYRSSIEPTVSIEPQSFLKGDSGVYTIKLKNTGIIDIYNVEIYENYLVCPCEKVGNYLECSNDNPTFPNISTLPSKQYQELKVGEEIFYIVDSRKEIIVEKMLFPCFMRLRLDYKRKADGRNFSKIFAFGLHGDMIVNLEHEGAIVSLHKNFARIRDFLLNKF